ncbi:MAG: 16S rRNA (adenine(1518)-N(6)/adenine(1519)-N(6))-dimethyltransferase RsmA [Syntrophales bacterium]|nr:16S rRNA (adenine(1518)-N(6)/adenine(1519)-N(6))-dimethyltransferase RsmA [Candidatus ainarchaeum sp.]MDD5096326.1 16S rRNA (adenine(1518)-N(6)/adenine(1519)-N(6))-dimethyltransferase RsmA [Candidatus ainarchaeum sp.]MDD5533591.1 16S rRNA (adenine(1518)-N(6)/adenine(1519)-N(6))-dimethyltransferase RsmA [Syntrophales bacterium]
MPAIRKSKRLGQHFLNSPHLLEFEADAAKIEGKDVIEIGGGDGRLTEKLLEKNPKRLTVIEKDSRWAHFLRERFGNKINLIEGDFLESGEDADVIVGNIPYYISSPIIFSIAKKKCKRSLLMVQLEFAERMVAKPKSSKYGRLSVTSQLLFHVKLLKKVSKGAFSPPPEVDSAIMLLEKKADSIDPWVEKIIMALFQHKNQMLSKALSHAGIIAKNLPRKRARELSPEEIVDIAESIRPAASLP